MRSARTSNAFLTPYVSSLHNELPLCLALEEMLDVEVPQRAKHIRTIMFELNRIASHLVWIGTLMLDLGAITVFLWAFCDRELVLDINEQTTDARMLPNYDSIGGLRRNLYPQLLEDVLGFCNAFKNKLLKYAALTINAPIFQARTVGVGVLDPGLAINHGVSGPVLRGSGIARDLRIDDPYDAYPDLEFEPCVKYGCDVYSRSRARFREFYQSIDLIC